MACIAVFASGSGSNFEAIAKAMRNSAHRIAFLVCDRKNAPVHERAKRLGVPVISISYLKQTKEDIEKGLVELLAREKVDIIVLAGFMRLLSAVLVEAFPRRIINIHPSLLPKYPGAHGIEDSYHSGDRELGISIHYVDNGMDSGPLILQKSIIRTENESLESIEARIHSLEHQWYPEVVLDLLNKIGK